MPVHPHAVGVAQDGPGVSAVDGPVDRSSDRRRQRDQHSFVTLAADLQHAVAVLLAEVAEGGAAGFEDAQAEQAEQAEHRDQGEVVDVRRQPRGGDQGLELQVSQPQRRRLGRDRRPAYIVGRRVRQDLVDDAHPVEADHHRQPAGHRRGPVAADVLQPAHVPFDVHTTHGQRVQALPSTPGQENVEIGVR
jgi:hypothetical protein